MTKIEFCIGEILELAAWLEKLGLSKSHRVEVIQDSGSGIGTSTKAIVKTSDKEGIFIDITDYDMW